MSVTSTYLLKPNVSERNLMNREEIFQELARKTCKVVWTIGQETIETSGCFIKGYSPEKTQVLSCFHDLSWASARTIQIIYQDRKSDAQLNGGISLSQARVHDLCILDFKQEDAQYSYFNFNRSFYEPTLGQKIYFAGFPFGTNYPVVHKGYISSAKITDESERFAIEGTIVRGHSGGPIVLAESTRLHLLGIISSQLCDISKNFIELSNTQLPSITAINDVAPSYGNSNIRVVLKETMECMLANFSTGIGKVTCLSNITSLQLEETKVSEEEEAAFEPYETEKFTNPSGSINLEDRSASIVFQAMQGSDPWMKRHGIGGSSSPVFELEDFDRATHETKPTELGVGKKNRDEKEKKKIEAQARQVRTEAQRSGNFQNTGLPPVLYRFVSTETAKEIKRNGIVHSGTDLDEIPFITQPREEMAQSIGAVSTEKMVTIFTDRIPGLSANNVSTLKQRNGVTVYKLNISIPKEAIQ